MYKKIKLVIIDHEYCNYLRKFDNKVMYNDGYKTLRPFVGILFSIDDIEYFAPLASPKEKHKYIKNKLDIIKIENGEYGVINLNNMIPVTKNNYKEIDLNCIHNDINTNKRIRLLKKQLRFIDKRKKEIFFKSKLLYYLYKNNKLPESIKNRCCNFTLLEKILKKFNK